MLYKVRAYLNKIKFNKTCLFQRYFNVLKTPVATLIVLFSILALISQFLYYTCRSNTSSRSNSPTSNNSQGSSNYNLGSNYRPSAAEVRKRTLNDGTSFLSKKICRRYPNPPTNDVLIGYLDPDQTGYIFADARKESKTFSGKEGGNKISGKNRGNELVKKYGSERGQGEEGEEDNEPLFDRKTSLTTAFSGGNKSLRGRRRRGVIREIDFHIVAEGEKKEKKFMNIRQIKPIKSAILVSNLENIYFDNVCGIPKIVHTTWKINQLPDEWQANQRNCQVLNPDFWFCHWTDEELVLLAAERSSELFFERFINFRHPIQKADAGRYLIMNELGGVYRDLDISCKLPFSDIFPRHGPFGVLLAEAEPVGVVGDFLAAKARHPLFSNILKRLETRRLWYGLPYLDVMLGTGPLLLSGVYWEMSKEESKKRKNEKIFFAKNGFAEKNGDYRGRNYRYNDTKNDGNQNNAKKDKGYGDKDKKENYIDDNSNKMNDTTDKDNKDNDNNDNKNKDNENNDNKNKDNKDNQDNDYGIKRNVNSDSNSNGREYNEKERIVVISKYEYSQTYFGHGVGSTWHCLDGSLIWWTYRRSVSFYEFSTNHNRVLFAIFCILVFLFTIVVFCRFNKKYKLIRNYKIV